MGIPARHEAVEGVQLRDARRDALIERLRRHLALRHLRLERDGATRPRAGRRHSRAAGPRAPGAAMPCPPSDCLACHGGASVPVLGVSALQLSPDRDPLAPHASPAGRRSDLRGLVARGLVRGLPPALLDGRRASPPPRRGTRRTRLPARQLRQLPQQRASGAVYRVTLAQRAAAPEAADGRCAPGRRASQFHCRAPRARRHRARRGRRERARRCACGRAIRACRCRRWAPRPSTARPGADQALDRHDFPP